jgi:hypothetical protein
MTVRAATFSREIKTCMKGTTVNITAPKLGATIALLALLGVGAVGCSSPEPSGSSSNESGSNQSEETDQVEEEPAPEPVSLEGEWKQTNSDDPERWQKATITGDTIEVSWVADAGDTEALYWAGTVEVPAEGESFSFDSVNDTTKTDSAMLASGDETKTFTYENGERSYDGTVQGRDDDRAPRAGVVLWDRHRGPCFAYGRVGAAVLFRTACATAR